MSNVSLQPQHGFQGAVTLDATATPAGVPAVWSPSVISGGETSARSMTSSAAGSFDVSISGTAGATVNHVTIHVQVIGVLSAWFTPPSRSFADEAVNFVGSASGGLSPYDYSWQLGDQSTMTGDRVSHVYSSEGVYRVNLTIHDGSGQIATANKVRTVARSTPGVLTEAATGVEDARATLHGDLRNLGEATTVIVGFRYGLDPTLSGATNWTTGPASAAGVYASLVTGLTPNTTYYFDAWANGHGFTTGGIMSFATMALSMPSGTPGATVGVEGTLGTNGWYISNVTVTLTLADGVHTFAVRATDVAGNKETQTRSVSIDTNPFSPFGPLAGLPLFLLVLALAIAITVLLLRRRRKGERTPTEP